jgi:phenylacetate-CoA ligase
MISLYGWKLSRLRFGGSYERYLNELLRSQYYSKAELTELQNERLRALIRQCYDNVPYYARLMRELKLIPNDFQTAEDLTKLPVLEKETVRGNPELFQATNFRERASEIVSTSGTTGTSLRIRVDVEGRRKNYAFFGRLKRWAGVDPLARSATFAGRAIVPVRQQKPPFWRYNLPMKNLLFSSFHLSERNMPAYLKRMRDWNPQLIDSYPSSLAILARFGLEHGLEAPHPRAVITSSETLPEDQRDVIIRAFQTRIFDQYGSAEQVCFISQCERGRYHVHPEYGIAEFLPTPAGEPEAAARIVATGLTNWAMPLLRYDMADLAVPAAGECDCGRKFQIVKQIVGRLDDLVQTPDGRWVGRLDPVFKGLQTVRRAQIIQEALNRIRVLIVPAKGFSSAQQDSIQHELERRLGPDIEYVFELVNEIPVGPGGKFRAVISQIERTRSS